MSYKNLNLQVSEFEFDNLALDKISSLTMKKITSTTIYVAYITDGTVISHADER